MAGTPEYHVTSIIIIEVWNPISYYPLNKNTCVRIVYNINGGQIFYNYCFVFSTLKTMINWIFHLPKKDNIPKMYKTIKFTYYHSIYEQQLPSLIIIIYFIANINEKKKRDPLKSLGFIKLCK